MGFNKSLEIRTKAYHEAGHAIVGTLLPLLGCHLKVGVASLGFVGVGLQGEGLRIGFLGFFF